MRTWDSKARRLVHAVVPVDVALDAEVQAWWKLAAAVAAVLEAALVQKDKVAAVVPAAVVVAAEAALSDSVWSYLNHNFYPYDIYSIQLLSHVSLSKCSGISHVDPH